LKYAGVLAPLFAHIPQLLSGRFYSIFPHILQKPQKPSIERFLTDDGANFASIVRKMQEDNDSFRYLLRALSRVIDGVADIRVREVGDYLITELKHDELIDGSAKKRASPWFELAQESDGTLRLLGMLVALYQRVSGPLIAIEEPENAIHPGALAVLSDILREASQRRQIIITTQSPDLISRFGVDELRVVEKVDGVTQIGPVDEHQKESIEEQLFTAGDLLRIEGLRREPVEVAEGDCA